MYGVAFDFIFLLENGFETVVAGGFDKPDGGVKFIGAGFLPNNFGIADLVFVSQCADGLFQLFVLAKQVVNGFGTVKERSGEINHRDQRQQPENGFDQLFHGRNPTPFFQSLEATALHFGAVAANFFPL